MRNTVWLTLFVLVGLTWAAPVWAQVCVPPPSGIVSWWPAEGNANDIIGPNSGLLQGGATFGPGKVGQAFSFNGVTAYVDLGANPSLNRPGDFTVEGWVNVQTFALDNKYIFADFDSGGNTSQGSLRIRAAGGGSNNRFSWYQSTTDGTNQDIEGATARNANQWYHVAVVRDDTLKSVTLYVNGSPDGSISYAGKTVVNLQRNKMIGRAGPEFNDYFSGLVDELTIYNRPLTAVEVAAIFAAGSAGKCKPSSCPSPAPTSRAYVANAGSNSVSVVNTSTNAVVATVPVGTSPVNIAVTPNGASAYVTNAGSNSVSVINTATNAVVATVPVGSNPVNVAITPDGASVYMTNAGSNTVSVINTATNAVVATITVGPNPVNAAITPDGTRAYVTNAGSFTVSVINTATNTVVATVPVGFNPVNVVIR